ncbi:DNA-3-methyladenine glycosylase [Pararhodobacter sp. SW119]|uniref:DNA-3-methyladenine glycosylase n=1 Tax=Pararhodobacter sp. SW119 TaxID=2780075 RepID=UPI001AE0CCE4|nr:DNA-3-methyladenine glycosylase [Pararhodobacter sp. SW119]
MPPPMLPQDWFERPATAVAPDLIGTELILRGCGGIITETEAYDPGDPSSHSHRGPNKRNAAMFGPGGRAYVYRSYGIHWCLNVVCGAGHGVLIRAFEPRFGIARMQERRGTDRPRLIASGPGRVGQALAVGPEDNHTPFDAPDFCIRPGASADLLVGPRIGITRAADWPRRFGMKGSAYLSRPFR